MFPDHVPVSFLVWYAYVCSFLQFLLWYRGLHHHSLKFWKISLSRILCFVGPLMFVWWYITSIKHSIKLDQAEPKSEYSLSQTMLPKKTRDLSREHTAKGTSLQVPTLGSTGAEMSSLVLCRFGRRLISNTNSGITYVPDYTSQQNQMSRVCMATTWWSSLMMQRALQEIIPNKDRQKALTCNNTLSLSLRILSHVIARHDQARPSIL
jgi:hypothetical protein